MSDHPDQPPAPASPGRETARDRPGAPPDVVVDTPAPAAGTADAPAEGGMAASATGARRPAPALLLAGVAAVLAVVAVALAWQSLDRVHKLEAELVRRQQAGTEAIAEARAAARQAQEQSREAAAKAALLELRVAEIGAARQQVDEVLQSMTRSRDEGVLAELDAGLRLAMHQSAITGSGDAVLLSLRHAEERLAQLGSPVLERVRRAVAVDLERAGAGAAPDPAALAALLDDALRSVDALPLLAEPSQAAGSKSPQAPPATATATPAAPRARGAADPARPAAAAPSATPGAPQAAVDPAPAWRRLAQEMWEGVRDETLSLVRLTRIDAPEAALLAPEQAVFLRRNLELRLLGARVAVLARRHEAAQADLAAARALLERYFDRRSRAVQAVLQTLRQVAAQARPAALPRPEATLAAIAAVGGR